MTIKQKQKLILLNVIKVFMNRKIESIIRWNHIDRRFYLGLYEYTGDVWYLQKYRELFFESIERRYKIIS
jgi:hypothetical protein